MKGVILKFNIGAYEIEIHKLEGRLEGGSLELNTTVKSRGEVLEIHWNRDEFEKLECTEPMDPDFETFFQVMPDQWVEMIACHFVVINFGQEGLESYMNIGSEINQDGQLVGFE